jgi:hypothetical protein
MVAANASGLKLDRSFGLRVLLHTPFPKHDNAAGWTVAPQKHTATSDGVFVVVLGVRIPSPLAGTTKFSSDPGSYQGPL